MICKHIYENIKILKAPLPSLECMVFLPEIDQEVKTTDLFILGLKTYDSEFYAQFNPTNRTFEIYKYNRGKYTSTTLVLKNLQGYSEHKFYSGRQIIEFQNNTFRVIAEFPSTVYPKDIGIFRSATFDEQLQYSCAYMNSETSTTQSVFRPVKTSERIYLDQFGCIKISNFEDVVIRDVNVDELRRFVALFGKDTIPLVEAMFSLFRTSKLSRNILKSNYVSEICVSARNKIDAGIPICALENWSVIDIDTPISKFKASGIESRLSVDSEVFQSSSGNTHLFVKLNSSSKDSYLYEYFKLCKELLQEQLAVDLIGLNRNGYLLVPGSAVYRKRPKA